MSTRVPASERTSQRLRELLGDLPDGEALSEVMKLGMRKIVEEALEAEVSDALRRGYSERGSEPRRGYRNGTRTARLKTAEGVVEYGAPQVADRTEPFCSRIREQLGQRTQALEDLAVEMYARGLSTRDIESVFRDEAGQSASSKPSARSSIRNTDAGMCRRRERQRPSPPLTFPARSGLDRVNSRGASKICSSREPVRSFSAGPWASRLSLFCPRLSVTPATMTSSA